MSNNLFWNVYKNLERELVDLSNLIHIDDKQLEVYSIKITELLIRTVVEVEAISKELYFQNGGLKPDDNDLFFDTDCLDLLESKWQLSKKQIQVSASNFYFDKTENKTLTPLRKANKRGSSSTEWQIAYQAVKHNRSKSLTRGNLKNFIRGLAGLYILNIYYRDNSYELEKDESATNFDNSLGSSIFSINIHINKGVSLTENYSKKENFDECIYLLKPTDTTNLVAQEAIKLLNEKTNERTNANFLSQIQKELPSIQLSDQNQLNDKLKEIASKLKTDNLIQVAKENGQLIKQAFDGLRYEAVLNKQQY